MKFFVSIDRSSFKINPNHGDDIAVVPGVSVVEVKSYGPNEIVEDVDQEGRWILLDRNNKYATYVCCSETSAEALTRKLRDNGCLKVEVSVSRKTEHVPVSETARYFFKYEDRDVICAFCFKNFPRSRLRSDYAVYGDGANGEDFNQKVCPHCDMWDCCELEFEDPEIVAAELGLQVSVENIEENSEGEVL